MSKRRIDRRAFLKSSAVLGAQVVLAANGLERAGARPADRPLPDLPCDLAVAKGDSPEKNCLAALDALGGMPRFVRPGDRVVIKPNPVGSNPPEDAINTHPDMLGAVVRECMRAGAKEVIAISHDGMRSFVATGLRRVIEENGGSVKALEEVGQFREVVVPRGKILRSEHVAADILDSDVFINMPIAKHHAGSEVTLSMKNLMGINWDRIRFHRTDLHQCIAELAATVRADLILMDANYVLMTNGPVGPGEVRRGRQVIAGVDPVAIDAFTTRAFWTDPGTIRHIRIAHE
ncbi:MAG: DUF362 domain-containing protein, partial [Candidatus Eisenbacteria bacterium]